MSSNRRFEFPQREPSPQATHLDQGADIRFSAAVTPGLTQAEIKRADFEQRSHAVTGKSIEPYIGEYDYIIGQSKYYLQRKSMQEQGTVTERRQAAVNLGRHRTGNRVH